MSATPSASSGEYGAAMSATPSAPSGDDSSSFRLVVDMEGQDVNELSVIDSKKLQLLLDYKTRKDQEEEDEKTKKAHSKLKEAEKQRRKREKQKNYVQDLEKSNEDLKKEVHELRRGMRRSNGAVVELVKINGSLEGLSAEARVTCLALVPPTTKSKDKRVESTE
eukprot:GFUD01112784.1.p1 GENE.GFUD01112784.1~~GFUD01112784.1.p1  ORF type:complete len:183 (-),score=68.40 GFUD01112784.1:37-531(-)